MIHISRPNPPRPPNFFFLLTSIFSKGKKQQQGFEAADLLLSLPGKSPPILLTPPVYPLAILHGWRWLGGAKNKNNWRAKMACCLRINGHLRLTTGRDFSSSYRPSTSMSPTKGTTGTPVRPQGATLNRHTVLRFGLEMYKQAWYSKCKFYGVSKILRKTKSYLCVCTGVSSDGRWVSGSVYK